MENVYPLLSALATPADLCKMSEKELVEIAAEVRSAILQEVSKTGGHFSSNLGTVELTVALYATFELPKDKVVWDTGHQAYPHKLLTGRLGRFPSLRKYGGMSGFLRRAESDYDFFGAGHAGTAISAALGFALARDRLGADERVVAVSGDAAIASGMSWEALNHAGCLKTDLTVVLNDNRMSIAPNVGALTNYLAKLRSRPTLQDLARRAKDVVDRIPGPLPRMAAGFRHGITHYLAPEPTGTIFEEIGFEYIGPVDGHDLPTLIEVFRNVRAARPRVRPRHHGEGQRVRGQRGGLPQMACRRAVRSIPTRHGQGGRSGHLHPGVRGGRDRLRRGGREGGRDNRRNAGRHRPYRLLEGAPGSIFRCRHRRAARSDLGGGNGGGRTAAVLRHLLNLPAARLRPGAS